MTGIELFAGAGGASIGIRSAGISSIFSIDCDRDAIETQRRNGFDCAVHGFVQELDPGQIPEADFGWASPPCPAWSNAGLRKGSKDGRNGYPHLFRLLNNGRKPTWLVIEQVEGICRHQRGCHSRSKEECPACYLGSFIMPNLRNLYAVVEKCVLDAAWFGVPQHRRRLITVCGPGAVTWPKITHSVEALKEAKEQGTYQEAVKSKRLWSEEMPVSAAWKTRPANTLRKAVPQLDLGPFQGEPPPELWRRMASTPDEPSRTITSKGNNAVWVEPMRYPAGLGRSASEPDRLDRPSPTVMTTEEKGTRASEASGWTFNGGPDRASDAAFLAVGRRRLEPMECASIQGFPPEYEFAGKKGSIYAQVGNAVPPKLAEVVAREVMKAHKREIRR